MPEDENSQKQDLNTLIGARIRKFREARGLRMRDVGAKVGLAYNTISKLETGQQQVTPKYLELFANFHGCEVHDLIPRHRRQEVVPSKAADEDVPDPAEPPPQGRYRRPREIAEEELLAAVRNQDLEAVKDALIVLGVAVDSEHLLSFRPVNPILHQLIVRQLRWSANMLNRPITFRDPFKRESEEVAADVAEFVLTHVDKELSVSRVATKTAVLKRTLNIINQALAEEEAQLATEQADRERE